MPFVKNVKHEKPPSRFHHPVDIWSIRQQYLRAAGNAVAEVIHERQHLPREHYPKAISILGHTPAFAAGKAAPLGWGCPRWAPGERRRKKKAYRLDHRSQIEALEEYNTKTPWAIDQSKPAQSSAGSGGWQAYK
jgi:hypothetical protein